MTAAREVLLTRTLHLVIDDFHYINGRVQLEIVRFLKPLVLQGLPVTLISVPGRANDVASVEAEMVGRLKVLNVGYWGDTELLGIAEEGFKALNLTDRDSAIGKRLAAEAFHSPHLMQQLCLAICQTNRVQERLNATCDLREPSAGWPSFFREQVSNPSKVLYAQLLRGPTTRLRRTVRSLYDGRQADIYGVILEAAAQLATLGEIPYERLYSAIRSLIATASPRRPEIERALVDLTTIARSWSYDEPGLEWLEDVRIVKINDPYLAFLLHWGRS